MVKKLSKNGGAADLEAFCRALWQHDDALVRALAPKIDPNGTDRWGQRPLLMAAQHGDRTAVSLLLASGACVDQDRVHLTPVTLAARRQAGDLVALLRDHGATMSIFTWVHLGDRTYVERALGQHPQGARLRDEEGTPLLHHAAEALATPMVELLLALGAPPSEGDANAETALHRVADLRQAPQESAAKVAALLLDHGADPNARNWDDVTPLHQAVRARNLAVAEVLLARGADPNARDKSRGSTPLRRAVSATGASGTAGTTALMAPLARLLLAHGADPDACDKRGVPVRASARAPQVLAVLEAHDARKRTPRQT